MLGKNNKRMKTICLICCRGGSKGIPNKNIKNFCGKPLLEWTINNATKADIFDEIILSTDSDKIAKVGIALGVTVPGLRPDFLATDNADVFDTHKYIFDQLNINDDENAVCILTNNPFIDSKLLKEGFRLAKKENFKTIALDTVHVGGDYLYFRQLYEKNGYLKFHFPDEMKKSGINRQAYKPTFTTINNMRWGLPSSLENYNVYKNDIIKNGIIPIPLSKKHNFDIDDKDDWNIAEAVFEKLFL